MICDTLSLPLLHLRRRGCRGKGRRTCLQSFLREKEMHFFLARIKFNSMRRSIHEAPGSLVLTSVITVGVAT